MRYLLLAWLLVTIPESQIHAESNSSETVDPLSEWIYPDSHLEKNLKIKDGQKQIGSTAGIFLSKDSFEEITNYYAEKFGYSIDERILQTDQGITSRIWADSPIKTIMSVDSLGNTSTVNILAQKPNEFSLSISIIKFANVNATKIIVSYLPLSEKGQ